MQLVQNNQPAYGVSTNLTPPLSSDNPASIELVNEKINALMQELMMYKDLTTQMYEVSKAALQNQKPVKMGMYNKLFIGSHEERYEKLESDLSALEGLNQAVKNGYVCSNSTTDITNRFAHHYNLCKKLPLENYSSAEQK